jgi:small conductance mechanosensitive channel
MDFDVNKFLEEAGRWVTTSGLRIFVILMVTLVIIKIVRLFLDHAFARLERCRNGKIKINPETFKPILYNFLRVILVLTSLALILESIGIRIESLMQTVVGTWIITSGLKILVVLTITFIVIKAVSMGLDYGFSRLEKRQDSEMKKRADTLKAVIRNIANVSLISISIIMILDALKIDVKPILATAGVLGVAIGFGAQQLVRDVINGFFILLDDQIRVGDVVNIAGKGGLVENVNIRMTTLRDLAGCVHYVRNGEITVVTNMTKEWSRYVFDVGVAYRENVDEVIEVLKAIDAEMRQDPEFGPDILEPLEVLGLDRFADSAVIVRVRTKTKPIRQWAVGREFNRRMKKKFDELGIEIPFPHMTLYMGQGKDGGAAPMNVNMINKNN